MDLHAGQMQGFFSKPVDHMTAMPILTQFVTDRLGDEDLVIIAPDAGRVKLVRKFAQKVGAPYALIEKERPAQQVAEIGYVIGDVKGKTAVIVDDIIGTGGTLSAAAQTVLDEGAEKVFAVATHGLFSGNAFETSTASPLAGIVVTDTVPLREGAPDLITPAHLRRHPRGLDPAHLHRRLGVRDLRRREPALLGLSARRTSCASPRTRSRPTPLAQLGGGRLAEPPLAPDPVPVAGGLELAEHGQHARLHPPAHQLVGGQVLAPHERGRTRSAGRTPRRSPPSRGASRS